MNNEDGIEWYHVAGMCVGALAIMAAVGYVGKRLQKLDKAQNGPPNPL